MHVPFGQARAFKTKLKTTDNTSVFAPKTTTKSSISASPHNNYNFATYAVHTNTKLELNTRIANNYFSNSLTNAFFTSNTFSTTTADDTVEITASYTSAITETNTAAIAAAFTTNNTVDITPAFTSTITDSYPVPNTAVKIVFVLILFLIFFVYLILRCLKKAKETKRLIETGDINLKAKEITLKKSKFSPNADEPLYASIVTGSGSVRMINTILPDFEQNSNNARIGTFYANPYAFYYFESQ